MGLGGGRRPVALLLPPRQPIPRPALAPLRGGCETPEGLVLNSAHKRIIADMEYRKRLE